MRERERKNDYDPKSTIPGQFFHNTDQRYHRDFDALRYSYLFLQDLRPFDGIVVIEEIVPIVAEVLDEHLSKAR